MKRRRFLASAVASTAVSFAGCASSESNGHTYTLAMPPGDEAQAPDGVPVLDFDRMGLANGQRAVIEAAVEGGSYVEADVVWSTVPGRNPITMEFKTVIQRIARHVDPDAQIAPGRAIETPSRYDRSPYLTRVLVEG